MASFIKFIKIHDFSLNSKLQSKSLMIFNYPLWITIGGHISLPILSYYSVLWEGQGLMYTHLRKDVTIHTDFLRKIFTDMCCRMSQPLVNFLKVFTARFLQKLFIENCHENGVVFWDVGMHNAHNVLPFPQQSEKW